MATEEKLKYFYDSAMTALKEKNDHEIEYMRKYLADELEEYKKTRGEDMEQQEQFHISQIKRDMQKELAVEKLKLRKELSKQEAAIKDKLFDEVGSILEQFRGTPEYKAALKDNIARILKFADGEEVRIYLSKSDEHLKDELEKECGVGLYISEVPFNGGLQAEIPGRNVFINGSYTSLKVSAKNAYVVKP